MPSSIHSLVTKSMALALILALTASLSHYAVAASGGAMGGGFSSHGVSGGSSSYRSRDYYSTRSGTTYVYRDCYCCSRGNYMLLRQNGNVGEDMDVFFYAVLASALIFIVVLAVVQFFYNTRSMKSVVKLQVWCILINFSNYLAAYYKNNYSLFLKIVLVCIICSGFVLRTLT